MAAAGCHAQTAPGHEAAKLSPELARRVEVMIRSKSDLPPEYEISIGAPAESGIPGYHQIDVAFSAQGKTSRPLTFLLSDDGKTLAQFNKFDISEDPKLKVSAMDRPSRGGSIAGAPVTIVVFDDLECPYCAKMHAQMFPALLERYKDQVSVVYRDFPLDFHPWAMHAAVDASCLASVNPAAYWSYVDTVHALAAQMSADEKTIAKTKESLDQMALDQAGKQKVNPADLAVCIQKQDETKIKASVKEGEALGVDGTPALFINGEKLSGAEPMELVYRMVDGALVAAGKTPPPPPPPPAAPATAPGPVSSPAKPGS